MQVSNPTGDYNNDGIVDAADYVVWRKANGQNVTLPNDSNSRYSVCGRLHRVESEFRSDRGCPAGRAHWSPALSVTLRLVWAAAAAVPEPTSVVLAGIGFAFVVGRRSSQTHRMLTFTDAIVRKHDIDGERLDSRGR